MPPSPYTTPPLLAPLEPIPSPEHIVLPPVHVPDVLALPGRALDELEELDVLPPASEEDKLAAAKLDEPVLMHKLDIYAEMDRLPNRSPIDIAAWRVQQKLVLLARDIGEPRRYIGFSAFALLALSRHCITKLWIGDYIVRQHR